MCKRLLCLTCCILVLGLATVESADLFVHYKLDEASGTVAADASGNGLTATGSGIYLAGTPGIVPNHSDKKAVQWAALGQAALASSATFDYTALQAFSFVATFTCPPGTATHFLYSKLDPSAFPGHWLMVWGSNFEFGYGTNSTNNYISISISVYITSC